MELIEDEFEDWISKPDLKVKPGDKVRIKTHEELLKQVGHFMVIITSTQLTMRRL